MVKVQRTTLAHLSMKVAARYSAHAICAALEAIAFWLLFMTGVFGICALFCFWLSGLVESGAAAIKFFETNAVHERPQH
jgi:hypothetical protein